MIRASSCRALCRWSKLTFEKPLEQKAAVVSTGWGSSRLALRREFHDAEPTAAAEKTHGVGRGGWAGVGLLTAFSEAWGAGAALPRGGNP